MSCTTSVFATFSVFSVFSIFSIASIITIIVLGLTVLKLSGNANGSVSQSAPKRSGATLLKRSKSDKPQI